ncbi:unnamed protein product, partial [Rotaria magnacalcarata]
MGPMVNISGRSSRKGLALNCVEALASRVKYFLFHVFVKREQSKFFELIKQNVNDQKCSLAKEKISLSTAYIWSKSNNYPFVIVSNDSSHDKYTVSKCLEQIFTRLKLLLPSLNELVIFSDGSASQFKQRYLFKNLTILAKRFSIDNKCAHVQQSLSTDIKQKIYDYYYRDGISYQASGKRDTITVKENSIKKQLQKRYLLCSLREIHQLFLEENPDIKIDRYLFQDLRPSNVLYK